MTIRWSPASGRGCYSAFFATIRCVFPRTPGGPMIVQPSPRLPGHRVRMAAFVLLAPSAHRVQLDGVPAPIQSGDAAGGDLSGSYPNPAVAGLQGRSVSDAAPADGQVLTWDGINSLWKPVTPSGGSSGATDHGQLDGLTDDDHPQYLLAEGVRSTTNGMGVTGTLNAGSIPVNRAVAGRARRAAPPPGAPGGGARTLSPQVRGNHGMGLMSRCSSTRCTPPHTSYGYMRPNSLAAREERNGASGRRTRPDAGPSRRYSMIRPFK